MRAKQKYQIENFEQAVPTGTINGTNVTFTLPSEPVEPKAAILWVNAVPKVYGTHWSLSGVTITMVTAPQVGQSLFVWYQKK